MGSAGSESAVSVSISNDPLTGSPTSKNGSSTGKTKLTVPVKDTEIVAAEAAAGRANATSRPARGRIATSHFSPRREWRGRPPCDAWRPEPARLGRWRGPSAPQHHDRSARRGDFALFVLHPELELGELLAALGPLALHGAAEGHLLVRQVHAAVLAGELPDA